MTVTAVPARHHPARARGRSGGSATGSGDSVSGHGPDADADRRRRARLDGADRARRCSPPATSSPRSSPRPWPPRRPPTPSAAAGGALVDAALPGRRGPGASPSAPGGRRSGRRTLPPVVRAAGHGCRRILQLVARRRRPGLRGRARRRLRHRRQRDVPAAHRRRRRRPAHRAQPERAAQRRRLVRRLPARPRLHGRRRHPGHARRGRRSARCRCSRCSPRCPTTAPRPAGRRGWSRCRCWSASSAPPGPSAGTPRRAGRRARCAAAPAACSPGSLLGLLAALAGGAVGPGRMRDVGPLAFDVLVHAITAFGIGGLLGGLAMTLVAAADRPALRQRRGPPRLAAAVPAAIVTRAPRRARLRRRHQPAGAARRLRATRRTAPAWSPSAPTATASRGWPGPSAPASRRSCTGSRTTTSRERLGRRADRRGRRARARPGGAAPAS